MAGFLAFEAEVREVGEGFDARGKGEGDAVAQDEGVQVGEDDVRWPDEDEPDVAVDETAQDESRFGAECFSSTTSGGVLPWKTSLGHRRAWR